MKALYILFSFVTMTGVTLAQQSRVQRADRMFDLLAYSEAIPLYERSLVNAGANAGEIQLKLAKSYYHFGDLITAKSHFKAAQALAAEFSAEDCFMFSQCLKQLGEYTLADAWMKQYELKMPGALSVSDLNKHPDYLQTIQNSPAHFAVATVNFNSPYNDFGGYELKRNQQLVILTDRNFTAVSRIYGWNQMNFLDYKVISDKGYQGKNMVNLRSGNTKFHEGPVCFTADEKSVYYTSNNLHKSSDKRAGIQNLVLYRADVDENGHWYNKRALKINSREYSVGHPAISNDGKWVIFVSDMPGGYGGSDLYKAEILPNGELGTPVNLGNAVNTEKNEMFPWISPQGQLFFSSNGLTGLGGLDIFVTEFREDGSSKGVKHAGPVINSPKDDFGLIFLSDGKHGYFSSNRDGGKGNDDIYTFELIDPFVFKKILQGLVTDLQTGSVLNDAEVVLLDERGQTVATVRTNEDGTYSFELDPEKEYSLAFKNNGYTELAKPIISEPGSDVIKVNAALEKIPNFGILCKVTEADTESPVEGAHITVKNAKTGEIYLDENTGTDGFSNSALEAVKMGDQLSLKITISKEGYLSKTVDLILNIDHQGIYNIHEMIDASIGKVQVGVDLATLIDIKPIYFDLGKFTIRKDAAIELDKIVKVMNDYPTMRIELGSHTDCRGSKSSNETLSANRAKASADYIKKRIKNPERIYGKGYGESKLKVDCPCEGAVKSSCPEEEHQKNRRTEFIIVQM